MSRQTPLTILLVDDSPEDRVVYRRFLGQPPAAAVCLEAATGAEGLRLCQQSQPDCIVLDLHLPDMHGLQFLTAMQAGQHLSRTLWCCSRDRGTNSWRCRLCRPGRRTIW